MSTLTDKAWESLQTGKTEFEVGVYTFNGCNVKVIQRKDPYNYTTRTGRPVTKSARYWGSFTFPNGIEQVFKNKRGGEIARATGFSVDKEQDRYKTEGENYVLPYERDEN